MCVCVGGGTHPLDFITTLEGRSDLLGRTVVSPVVSRGYCFTKRKPKFLCFLVNSSFFIEGDEMGYHRHRLNKCIHISSRPGCEQQ